MAFRRNGGHVTYHMEAEGNRPAYQASPRIRSLEAQYVFACSPFKGVRAQDSVWLETLQHIQPKFSSKM